MGEVINELGHIAFAITMGVIAGLVAQEAIGTVAAVGFGIGMWTIAFFYDRTPKP